MREVTTTAAPWRDAIGSREVPFRTAVRLPVSGGRTAVRLPVSGGLPRRRSWAVLIRRHPARTDEQAHA